MNTGSLPAELLPPAVSPSPSVSSTGFHSRHGRNKPERHPSRDYLLHVATKEGAKAPPTTGAPPSSSEQELITLLVNRLMAAETQLSYARQTIKQREFHITVLEEKLRLYMKAEEDAVGSRSGFLDSLKDSRLAQIEAKCGRLERQVMEMERFLGEFGMVWCEDENTYVMDPACRSGSSSESDQSSRTGSPLATPRTHHRVRIKKNKRGHSRALRKIVIESTSRSISSDAEPFSLDYEHLLAAITDLNIQTHGDAVAEGRESLQITLYKNGLVIGEDTPFRSFEQVDTRRLLQDILDGFFPSELTELYPNGVPLKVRDKRQVIFLPKSRSKKEGTRPPVPPKPPLTQGDSGLTFSSLTSAASFHGESISETEGSPLTALEVGDSEVSLHPTVSENSHLCPEAEYKSESSELSSRRNSLQRTSDKSEGEGKTEALPATRESEMWVPPDLTSAVTATTTEPTSKPLETRRISEVQRIAEIRRTSIIAEGRRGSESRRMSDARRGSEARRMSDARRGSEYRIHACRRRSDARRLEFDLSKRIPAKHPLEWNRINRTGFPLHDDNFDTNGNQLRRGSIGMTVSGIATDPYDVDTLRKRRTSVEDFLSKVPSCVIKSGKLINLREEVADMIMGSQRRSSLTLVHTPVLDEAGESQEGTDPEDAPTPQAPPQDVIRTSLRIKVENASETYLIKLKASDTLDTLRNYLKSYRGDDQDFEIVRSYPYEVLSKSDATMSELGLVPNAVLHLKCSSQSSEQAAVIPITTASPFAPFTSSCLGILSSSSVPVTFERDKTDGREPFGGAVAAAPFIPSITTDVCQSILANVSSVGIPPPSLAPLTSITSVTVTTHESRRSHHRTTSTVPSCSASPRHTPSPLPVIPPNLHPDIPSPLPVLRFSEDRNTKDTTTVTTVTATPIPSSSHK